MLYTALRIKLLSAYNYILWLGNCVESILKRAISIHFIISLRTFPTVHGSRNLVSSKTSPQRHRGKFNHWFEVYRT